MVVVNDRGHSESPVSVLCSVPVSFPVCSSHCSSPHTHRPKGSDCGIVNVNIPTSGAEIGGAFGM